MACYEAHGLSFESNLRYDLSGRGPIPLLGLLNDCITSTCQSNVYSQSITMHYKYVKYINK